jgi:hypothetical protein
MPLLSVWAVRLAIGYLTVGAVLGTLLLAARAAVLPTVFFRQLAAHIDVMLVGWLVQLAVGVGYWILPRVEGKRPRAALAVTAVALLNIGVPLAAAGGTAGIGAMVLAGRMAELAGALTFGAHAWTRVRYGGLVGRVQIAPDS